MSEDTESERVEEYRELTNQAQRKLVCRRLGTNESHRTALSKESMNSLVAYLTGSFVTEPGKLFVEGAPVKGDMMETISALCGNAEWMEHYMDVQRGHRNSRRAFNSHERARILAEMDERGDQREWVDGEFSELSSNTAKSEN